MKNQSFIQDEAKASSSPRYASIWQSFTDAFLGPKNYTSGIRRKFRNNKSLSLKFSFILIAAAIVSGFLTYAALTETPPLGDDPKTVIWLLNIDLIILLTLFILIARRIIAIWSGRKQNIAGSHLHVRLVVIFSIMAAAPAIIMAIFSAFFFHFGVQSWFSDNVKTAIVKSQAVATAYLEEHQKAIKADILAMANDIDRQAMLMMDSQAAYDQALDTQSLFRNLTESMIFNKSGKILSRSGLTFTLTFETVPDYVLEQAQDGEVVVLTGNNDDRVRALVRLNSGNDNFLFVGRKVDASVLSNVSDTRNATANYTQLEAHYSDLQITVTLIFVVVALLLLMAAIWIGIVLARQLVTPISSIISASDRVRAGDLTVRIHQQKEIEEFDQLGQSFNRMTEQLQQHHNDLINANRQLDQRRRLTETVLTGVSAGVIGVDKDGKINLANSMAEELFECESKELISKNIADFLPQISSLLNEAMAKPNKISQSEIPYTTSDNNHLTLMVRIALEMIDQTSWTAVLTFDDITELQSAQRKAAWADVARRVAHEIKNPLTPIQLSAERLKRKYRDQINSDQETFDACTDTIIRHVGDIGRMVNEFSDFARLPESVLVPSTIILELKEIVIFQKSAHHSINFTLEDPDTTLQNMIAMCDKQQIRQAFTNLIQNAVDSIEMKSKEQLEEYKGHIRIFFEKDEAYLYICVTDNGLGLPKNEDPSKLSDPYVTHRPKGTGLGLAIVKKIMTDHKGQLIIGSNSKIKSLSQWKDLGGATVSLAIPSNANELIYSPRKIA